ncbi:hypothetical protein Slin15195_G061510 [Septoria linicola]|uniref:Uncharacterized protein n=1 Tax=Septoria linicola TaxID=215465 RepID=A0A9Q9EK33_9PEZI|nr:hypothetical protein Slin14017_G077310 [Septoria linicola]USW52832.1 hypothetical protein Slin15195_G061510 [Septoria linicola]
MAATVSAAVQFLFDTPFLEDVCSKDGLGFLVSPGQGFDGTALDCPLYLRRKLAAVHAAPKIHPSNASTHQSPQAIMLMLGILLLELCLDEACQKTWTGDRPSVTELQNSLHAWHKRVSPKLPQRIERAIRACVKLGFAPTYIAEAPTRELDEIAENMSIVSQHEDA